MCRILNHKRKDDLGLYRNKLSFMRILVFTAFLLNLLNMRSGLNLIILLIGALLSIFIIIDIWIMTGKSK